MLLLLLLLPKELLIPVLICGAIYFIVIPGFKRELLNRNLKKWSSTPKDLVILHGTPRSKSVPHTSPFFLKLETFLRMAKIPYEVDIGYQNKSGPKGKFPWISINGVHMGDTQFIIEYLTQKFEVKFNGHYSKEQLATASAIRIVLEDHFFWGLSLSRYVFSTFSNYKKLVSTDSPVWKTWLIWKYMSRVKLNNAKAMGLGLHSQIEIEQLALEDLNRLSSLLGSKKFLLGEEPCEHDCGVFGQLSQALWGCPGSVYEKALNDEFLKLKEYCERIKSKYYPDWEALLQK